MDIGQAIQALGGANAVANALGEKRSTVSMWAVRQRVPSEQVLPFWNLCLAAKVGWIPPGADAIRERLAAQEPEPPAQPQPATEAV